jgi:hypothetical protein
MWKYFVVAAIALLVGAVAPALIIRLASSIFHNSRVELMEAWSSEGKDWIEFSRFIEAGGRAYWSGDVVFDGLESGMDEEDLRRTLGPPDAVLIGEGEISSSLNLVHRRSPFRPTVGVPSITSPISRRKPQACTSIKWVASRATSRTSSYPSCFSNFQRRAS